MDKKWILASASPRRRELLHKILSDFELAPVDADESSDSPVYDRVKELAERKATECAKNYTEGIIIGADTLVALNGEILGKPADKQDAFRMLRALSGKTHEVMTGVCLLDASTGRKLIEAEISEVTFRNLTDSEIEAYIATGEPMDKAGSYGIQGKAGVFVENYEGSYENIIGLPVQRLADMLERFLNEGA